MQYGPPGNHGYGGGYGGPPRPPYPHHPYPHPQPPLSPYAQIRRVERKLSRVFLVLVLVGTAVFVVGIFALVFFLTRPRGEKIGETNLVDPRASIAVDAAAGDALFFRTDVSVAVPSIDLMDSDARERQIDRYLRGSTLTIRAKSPAGQERTTSCAVYNGRATSTSTIGSSLSRSGMLNDCTIAIDAPGRWTVSGSVAWAPALSLTSATLEARREKPGG